MYPEICNILAHIAISVTGATLVEQGTFLEYSARLLTHRFLFASISLWYYYALGSGAGGGRIRKIGSNSDLPSTENNPTPSTSAKKDD